MAKKLSMMAGAGKWELFSLGATTRFPLTSGWPLGQRRSNMTRHARTPNHSRQRFQSRGSDSWSGMVASNDIGPRWKGVTWKEKASTRKESGETWKRRRARFEHVSRIDTGLTGFDRRRSVVDIVDIRLEVVTCGGLRGGVSSRIEAAESGLVAWQAVNDRTSVIIRTTRGERKGRGEFTDCVIEFDIFGLDFAEFALQGCKH